MGDLTRGVEAGFAATVLISLLILAQHALGLSPEFDLITMATAFTGQDPVMGWIFHFFVGSVIFGLGFAVFSPHLFGPHWLRGATFGVLAWLLMMVAFLPVVHMPIFARGMGITIPTASLIVHLLYGLALGEIYHLLVHYFPVEVEEENA